jgi:iron complex transport system ATP-binding protein
MKLTVEDAACGYTHPILEHINMEVTNGEVLCILGPNGVGKTTLFKTILGLLPPKGGQFLLDGEDLLSMDRVNIARKISFVPQGHAAPFSFLVRDVVAMGRTAYLGILHSPTDKDFEKVDTVMEQLGIDYLENKYYTQISGGERQMVLIARALVQDPELLIMDEPTSNLDFGNQVKVLKQVKAMAERGIGVVMTTHVPDHCFMCATNVLLIKRGSYIYGDVDNVVTEENLHDAYGVDVYISKNTADGKIIKSCVAKMD